MNFFIFGIITPVAGCVLAALSISSHAQILNVPGILGITFIATSFHYYLYRALDTKKQRIVSIIGMLIYCTFAAEFGIVIITVIIVTPSLFLKLFWAATLVAVLYAIYLFIKRILVLIFGQKKEAIIEKIEDTYLAGASLSIPAKRFSYLLVESHPEIEKKTDIKNFVPRLNNWKAGDRIYLRRWSRFPSVIIWAEE